ncbi:hypothetical protein [Rhizobium grahamii]|uniref:Uncharacterized protein n=1 Tax=Rhizobium grahamii CCGE 502 TaxID=990285 RepID=S3IIA4_9HYPH|nr:hypothetical protein [Rhizobium grahamii]EPE98598.1 hypothetical protein RGCCGE502_09235 [Rhizobium grahamii CCGE 502]
MSRRIRTAEQSARRETAIAKEAILTAVADGTAPRDPRARGDHYRRHLTDAHRTIGILQNRIAELEAEKAKIKRQAEYDLSLCVTRREAEEGRLGAFRLAKGLAVNLAEPDDVPNHLSEAIWNLPDPKPKWSR